MIDALRRAAVVGRFCSIRGFETKVERTCAYRKSSPSILVMQSTQDRAAQNASRCLGGT